MAKTKHASEANNTAVPFPVLLIWIFGGTSFALIVYLFTPYTHNLDDIKVTFQYVLAPIVWGFFVVAVLGGHVRRIHPAILLSFSAFFLVFLLSTIFGQFPWRAWHDLGFHLTIASCFIAVLGTATTEKRFRNICLFYFLVGCGTVVFGLFHYFGGVGFLLQQIFPKGQPQGYFALYTLLYTLRANGDMLSTILNRDFYPAYLLMIVPLGVAMALDYSSLRAKLFFLLFFFLMCVCIMLAFSKDTYLALFIMAVLFVVLYAAKRDWRRLPRQVMWVWGVGGVIVFATVLYAVREKFQGLSWESYISVMSRKVIWGGALGIWFDAARPIGSFIKHILLGGGPGAFYLAFPLYRSPDYHLYEISNVTLFSHNQYLDLLCEEGLLGLGVFLFFFGAIAWLLFRELWRKREHPLNVYQIALFTSLAGISFQNIFSPNIRWTVCGFNYWFMLGLAAAAAHLTFSKEKLSRIDAFYAAISPRLKKTLGYSFLTFTLIFEAISVPYGLIRFNAAKENNDGLINLSEFTVYCDRIVQKSELRENREFMAKARSVGMQTITNFKRALKWQPTFITSYYKLAHVYSRFANISGTQESELWWAKAKKTYDRLKHYAPDYSEIHFNYGILAWFFYVDSRDPEQMAASLRSFHRATQMSNKLPVQDKYHDVLLGSASVLRNIATTQTLAQHVRAIEPALKDIVPPPKEDDSFAKRLAALRRLINAGETRQAAQLEADILQELALRVGEHILTLRNYEGKRGEEILAKTRRALVREYFLRNSYDKALPILETLLKNDNESTGALRLWTTAAMRVGEPRKCLELLASLIEHNPLNWAARDAAREVLQRYVGDDEKALNQTRALLKILDPKGPLPASSLSRIGISRAELLDHAGEAAEKLNRLEDAYNYFREAAETAPDTYWGKQAQIKINRILKKLQNQPVAATTPTSSRP